MLYKKLGKTGLDVSVIGFGGIPIQRINADEAKAVILRAEELGINFIDSARGYTVSEAFIGEALEGRRDKWIIATKTMARTKAAMLADIETSLVNLRTDYIDLYQMHNVKDLETYHQVMAEDGAMAALKLAKAEGKIRHIGVSAHTIQSLEVMIESGEFETIMYPYNIIENQAEKLFARAHELGVGVIAMKPMAGGALTDGTLAMKYILSNPNVSIAIPGMAGIDEVDQNCAATAQEAVLTEEEKSRCKQIAEELGQDFCRRCGYCMPCPKGIDIPVTFILKGYFDNYDLKDWAHDRYKSASSHASDCEECGLCEQRCPYELKIREKLKVVNQSFGY